MPVDSGRQSLLLHIHAQAVTLIQFEARLVLDRATSLTAINSGLLAVASILGSSGRGPTGKAAVVILAGVSALLSVAHILIANSTRRALDYWRATSYLVEADREFMPADLHERDLDIISARVRSWTAHEPVAQDALLTSWWAPPPPLRYLNQKFSLEPMAFYGVILPMLFVIAWILVVATLVL